MDKYIRVTHEEIDRLNGIVVDFVFAVRPMNMEFRPGDINDLIRRTADFVLWELEEAGITCSLDLDESIPPLEFDERYLKQALFNLIKNAIAAMPEGGTLSIKTSLGEGELRIIINDTGMGISEENLSKIFEPYFTTKENGSGLGLTLVFKILREHGGEISVNSQAGKGTSFILSIPIPQEGLKLLPSLDRMKQEQ
jgi:signal transduction histidine kinase